MPGAANPQAWNRYSYVVNNPLKYTDPTGHMYECSGTCGRTGTFVDVINSFIDSPFAEYYGQLANAERSIYAYDVNPSDANKIIMETDIATARVYKARALPNVPSGKLTDAMNLYPDILGGGYVEGETDLGGEFGGFGGSVVDPGVTPILPNGQHQTPTPTLTSTPTQKPTPTRTPTPTQTNRSTPIPRRYGGVLMD